MNMFGANAMRALLWSAVINSVLAAPVLMAMMLVATRREMMGGLLSRPCSRRLAG
jgi:Mn2+/Fe2+ NRAMP family transporter